MAITIIKDFCKGCGFCITNCPKKVYELSAEMNKKGYRLPSPVRIEKCTECGICDLYCRISPSFWKRPRRRAKERRSADVLRNQAWKIFCSGRRGHRRGSYRCGLPLFCRVSHHPLFRNLGDHGPASARGGRGLPADGGRARFHPRHRGSLGGRTQGHDHLLRAESA
jgi:2-oxoglutarate ferredoxin oxidoreductase subunit delta